MSDETNDTDTPGTDPTIDMRPGAAIEAAKRASKVAPPPLPGAQNAGPTPATTPTLTIVEQTRGEDTLLGEPSLGESPAGGDATVAPTDASPSDQPELVLASPTPAGPVGEGRGDDDARSSSAKPKRTRRKAAVTDPPEQVEEQTKLLGRPLGNIRQVLVNLRIETRDLLDARVATNGTALGVEAMAAVRATHKEFRAEAPEPEDDNDFAPPRRFVRQMPKGEKRSTTISVSNEEAAALSELSAVTQMSVAYLIDEAIRRHWG